MYIYAHTHTHTNWDVYIEALQFKKRKEQKEEKERLGSFPEHSNTQHKPTTPHSESY